MEIIEIKSAHSLVTSITDNRPGGEHSYQVNCRQYVSIFHDWQKSKKTTSPACGIMTLEFVRIWITEQEGNEIAEAIKAARSPVVVA